MIQQYKAFLVTTQVLWIRNVWLGCGCLCELMEMGDGAFGSMWLVSITAGWLVWNALLNGDF